VTTSREFPDLGALLNPASVVVVGASAKPGSFGGETLKNLQRFGYGGRLYAVNPKGGEIEGITAHTDVASLPEAPDLAILSVPVTALLGAIEECVTRGIRAGIAYAGGLRETGPDGARLQQEIADYCARKGFVLNGPNGLGVVNLAESLVATFSTQMASLSSLTPGPISIVSQSGGIATNLMKLIDEAGFGTRMLVSTGNEAVIGTADVIAALAADEGTRVIAIYAEGIDDGPRFIRSLELARDSGTSVVMIKSGTTQASAAAAKAHTGAMTGEDRVFDHIVRQLGVIRVDSVQELLETSVLLAGRSRRAEFSGGGLGVATIGGGNGVMAIDRASSLGLPVPALDASAKERLSELLVEVATASNPVDLTPASFLRQDAFERLPQVFGALAASEGVDVLLLLIGSMAARADAITTMLEEFAREVDVPIVVAWPPPPPGVAERLARAGIAMYADVVRAVEAIARVAARVPSPAEGGAPMDAVSAWGDVGAGETAPFVLSEDRAAALLGDFGIPAAASRLVATADDAVRAAAEFGYPIALKGISPQITHRAAVGALALDIRDEAELRAEYARIAGVATALDAELEGQLVEKMYAGRIEVLASIFRDPVFGPVISVGSGGVLTELIDDIRISPAPVDETQALEMLHSLKVVEKFGGPGYADALAETARHIAALSAQATVAPWAGYTLEVNPLKISEAGPVAVDALLIVDHH